MKLMTLSLAFAAATVFAQAAQAHEHHHRYHHHVARSHHHRAFETAASYRHRGWGFQGMQFSTPMHLTGGVGPRPAAWCGWAMRQLVGADPGPSYNLARNWAHWGHAGPAGVGAVVVWPHHVGRIVGQENGQWVIESGNDGHALRTRARSIAGAIAIRWG